MENAAYGLMRKGRCVTETLLHEVIGCSTNSLGYFDLKCSGLSSCEVILYSKELKDSIQNCPEPYLEASYFCQSGNFVFYYLIYCYLLYRIQNDNYDDDNIIVLLSLNCISYSYEFRGSSMPRWLSLSSKNNT
jgi:hypothetical protein